MSSLSKLKLVAAHAEKKSPMVLRRAKLTGKLLDQISFAKAVIGLHAVSCGTRQSQLAAAAANG